MLRPIFQALNSLTNVRRRWELGTYLIGEHDAFAVVGEHDAFAVVSQHNAFANIREHDSFDFG
jgi:hypothetical protein